MKKKTIITITVVAILIILGYFGYKGFNLYWYNLSDRVDGYDEIIKNYKVEGKMTIQKSEQADIDYLVFSNMKIKNDFKDLKKIDGPQGSEAEQYVLRGDNQTVMLRVSLGKSDTYLSMIKNDKSAFNSDDQQYKNINAEKILKDNNIKNDIDLFKYLEKNKDKKNNIFTSVKEMKENYFIKFLITTSLPDLDNIITIDGEYQGYIINAIDRYKEVSIIKDDKRYCLIFIGEKYTDDYIKDILSTLVID